MQPTVRMVAVEKLIYHLRKAGKEAYLIGGCVRDRILANLPKDYDIVTNAVHVNPIATAVIPIAFPERLQTALTTELVKRLRFSLHIEKEAKLLPSRGLRCGITLSNKE